MPTDNPSPEAVEVAVRSATKECFDSTREHYDRQPGYDEYARYIIRALNLLRASSPSSPEAVAVLREIMGSSRPDDWNDRMTPSVLARAARVIAEPSSPDSATAPHDAMRDLVLEASESELREALKALLKEASEFLGDDVDMTYADTICDGAWEIQQAGEHLADHLGRKHEMIRRARGRLARFKARIDAFLRDGGGDATPREGGKGEPRA